MTRSSISASVIRRKQITHIDKLLVQRVEHGRLLTVLSLRKRKKEMYSSERNFVQAADVKYGTCLPIEQSAFNENNNYTSSVMQYLVWLRKKSKTLF